MKATLSVLTYLLLQFYVMECSAQDSLNGVLFSNEAAAIKSTTIDCVNKANGTAKQYLALEVQNNSDSPISVSFKKELWYDGNCISCNSNGQEFSVVKELEPNQTLVADCESDKSLKIFVKMLEIKGVRQLTHFELKDIEIKTN